MATSVGFFQSTDPAVNLLQQRLNTILNAPLNNPLLSGNILSSVSLASGANTINHGLGRTLVGWFPVRVRASATLYDTQDSNNIPNLTLQLVASAAVVVDLYVF